MDARRVTLFVLLPVLLPIAFLAFINASHAQKPVATYQPTIPKTWDKEALDSLEVPLAEPSHSPRHISAEDYYRLPVRPIYKSYTKYGWEREPRGYRDWLRRQEPLVLWDEGAHRPRLETEADWIKAGELVFDAPVLFFPGLTGTAEESRAFDAKTGDFDDGRGISPFADYVIRERGKVEIGEGSCRECHTRLMPDDTVIKGAQGNRPVERVAFLALLKTRRRPKTERNSSPGFIRGNVECLRHPGCGRIPTLGSSNSRRPKSRRSTSRFRLASSPVRARARSLRRSFPI